MSDSGPQLFARFAYPPNALGYCGPGDPRALIEQVGTPSTDDGLRAAAARFEGAYPYLQLIAAANGIGDPLDPRVVEAYWIGNPLLEHANAHLLGDSMEERFRARAGRQWDRLLAPVPAGARPHHNFHVFAVYPWLGLIRSAVDEQPLHVLDRCRIRWGGWRRWWVTASSCEGDLSSGTDTRCGSERSGPKRRSSGPMGMRWRPTCRSATGAPCTGSGSARGCPAHRSPACATGRPARS